MLILRAQFDNQSGLQQGQDGAAWEHFRDASPQTIDLAVYGTRHIFITWTPLGSFRSKADSGIFTFILMFVNLMVM